jgi:hypothetical protein
LDEPARMGGRSSVRIHYSGAYRKKKQGA